MESIFLRLFILLIFFFFWSLDYTLLRKLGYSRIFSGFYAFALLIVYPIALFILLCLKWPIQRKIRDLRVRYGQGIEDDAYELLEEGIRYEAKSKYEEAMVKYQEVLTRFRDTNAGKDAKIALETLRSKL